MCFWWSATIHKCVIVGKKRIVAFLNFQAKRTIGRTGWRSVCCKVKEKAMRNFWCRMVLQ